MSLPASDPNEPNPAAPATADTPPAEQEFDLLAFWIEHGKLIIRLVTLALVAVGIWGAVEFMQYRKRVGSEEALAMAKSPEEFRKVIADWSGTPSAGIAHLRLADELRKAGKPEEAAAALKDFLEKYPLHPLRAGGAHALAADLETAGKLDEALAAYQRLGSFGSKSAFAPLAFIGQARVLNAQGKPDEARRALETVQQQFPGSPFFEEANAWLEEIKNPAGTKTGGSPRPTPTPAPAPPPGAKVTSPPSGTPVAPPQTPAPQIPAPAPPAGTNVPPPMPQPAPPIPPAPINGAPTPPPPPTQPPGTPAPPPVIPAPPAPTNVVPPPTPVPPAPAPTIPGGATPPVVPPAPPAPDGTQPVPLPK